jgi:hypothetical protein
MSEGYVPKDKADLLNVIRKERDELDAMISDLTLDQKIVPGVEASWSVKDIMAHISAWERLAQDRIHAALTGEPIKIPLIEGDNFVDDFNAEVYAKNQSASLETVDAEYKASYVDFLAQVESLYWDFIQAVLPFDWAGDLTALVLISANTHWHYLEHAASIRLKIKDL